jgi:hypothetical protein
MACTVVSAYYEIPSKHHHELYRMWGQRFLTLAAPIVLFVDPSMVEWVRNYRGDKPIHIIEMPFNELEMWIKYQDVWRENHTRDPERHIHSPELYAIWAQKSGFVERAIQCNPFHTEYFFWCDFGIFREEYPIGIMNSFPHTRYLYKDKIILHGIQAMSKEEWHPMPDGLMGIEVTHTWNEPRIVGGLWGGGIEGCLRWNRAYEDMLKQYVKRGRFMGKDQIVMLSAYLHDPSLAVIVETTIPTNPWFFLLYLCSNARIVFKTELSYLPL